MTSGIVKISDFGVAQMFDEADEDVLYETAGSPAFLAPELCQGTCALHTYTKKDSLKTGMIGCNA